MATTPSCVKSRWNAGVSLPFFAKRIRVLHAQELLVPGDRRPRVDRAVEPALGEQAPRELGLLRVDVAPELREHGAVEHALDLEEAVDKISFHVAGGERPGPREGRVERLLPRRADVVERRRRALEQVAGHGRGEDQRAGCHRDRGHHRESGSEWAALATSTTSGSLNLSIDYELHFWGC
jgi:hypothetical protein